MYLAATGTLPSLQSALANDLPIFDLESSRVNPILVSPEEICRHRNSLGRIGCALARDAKLVAGEWRRPDSLEISVVDRGMYNSEMGNAFAGYGQAIFMAGNGCSIDEAEIAKDAANRFAGASARTAEHLVKAILIRAECQPQATHDVKRLARRVESRDKKLAQRLRSLNGDTH